MGMLDRKLLRDLERLWAQALAIAFVIAAGVATLVLGHGAYRSLEETRLTYYDRYGFGDVFSQVTRAPIHIAGDIAELPGVLSSEVRITKNVLIDIPGFPPPASGLALSIPDYRQPTLNRLLMRAGRTPEPGVADEVVVDEAFARVHSFYTGSQFAAIMNGKRRTLRIVGIALSPEFIYALGPGDIMPDPRRFAVLWMSQKTIESIFDLKSAFNSVAIKVQPGASVPEVIRKLDLILADYGGSGSYGRREHQSHAFIDAELKQIASGTRIIPPIFLFVSAFLINITLSRLVTLEREQIGLLQAIGYTRMTIAWHYVKFVVVISVIGILLGWALGTWLGAGVARLYQSLYNFPFLIFRHDGDIYANSALISAVAAVLGAAKATNDVLALKPAVAMLPPTPPRYRKFVSDKFSLAARVSRRTVMAMRNLVRRPVRTAFTTLGLSLSVAILVTALFTFDSVEFMIDVTFFQTERQAGSVTFSERSPATIVDAVSRLPGVTRAEPFRAVPVRFRNGHLERRVTIIGKPADQDLSRILNLSFKPVPLPDDGVIISERLANILELRRGDYVDVEVLEGRRQTLRLPIADVFKSYLGLGVFMRNEALNRMMDEDTRITGVHISYDRNAEEKLFAAVKETPTVASIGVRGISLTRFRETLAKNIAISTTVYVFLSSIIAFGVVYNTARVQLSERARELASLRVLGFNKAEVAGVLLTELALLTVIATPIGWLLGTAFAWATVQGYTNDLYSLPLTIETSTYSTASLIVFAAALVSAYVVRRRVDELDLVAVLKSRD